MSIFTKVDSWFHKQTASLEKLLDRIEPLVADAEPIVEEIAEVASGASVAFPALAPEAAIFAAVAAYLKKQIASAVAVNTFIGENQHLPVHNVLHNAATLALRYSGRLAVPLSDLDTAAQLAYSAFKESAAAKASPVRS